MCSPQYLSQQSTDFDIYFPTKMTIEDTIDFQSLDRLLESFNLDSIASSHRFEKDLFDPTVEDQEATLSLISTPIKSEQMNNLQPRDLYTYFRDTSTVVPHISREPIPIEEQYNSSTNLRKFFKYDPMTGRERRPLLHEFIRQLLESDEYSHMIEYIDRKRGIFKIHKPKVVSELWKHVKGRNSDNSKC